jgi:hypothetical protein
MEYRFYTPMADYLGLRQNGGLSGLKPGDVISSLFSGEDCCEWEVIGLSESANGRQAVVVIPARKSSPGNVR